MTNRYTTKFWLLLAATALWCVAMPFFWAYNLGQRLDPALTYPQVLVLYLPELVTGGIFLLCLPFVFMQPCVAVAGLAFAALLLPLDYAFGTPAGGWPVETALLLLLSWRLHMQPKAGRG